MNPMRFSWRRYGTGRPATLIVPGLAATEGESRIPASGIPGSRIVLDLPGHGGSADPPPEYWDYGTIAADVLSAADAVAARQAIGVSLGAGALTRIAAEYPDRFERLVLLLPAVLDRPRASASPMAKLAAAIDDHDDDRLRELLSADLPPGVDLGDYVDARARALKRVPAALRALSRQSAITDAESLRRTSARVLVIGATGDSLHPWEVAKDTAGAFSAARLEVFDSVAPLLTHRRELRELIVGFLS